MYILTIPSFTWVGPIAQTGSSIPYARAGHTCNLRDGQMVVVGGFNTTVTSCDSPGFYVFNASSLEWTSSFTALDHADDLDSGNSVLASSYGYTVPDPVVSVIGGSPSGSATVTKPASSATGGPFATGKPPTYTITAGSGGPTATITSAAQNNGAVGDNGGLIAAIVIACIAGSAAAYLGYCAWLYRRQVRAYKTHLAVQNRFPARSASHGSFGRMLVFGRKGTRKDAGAKLLKTEEEKAAWAASQKPDGSSSGGGESFGWVGREKLLDPSSAGGSKTTPASSGLGKPSPSSEYQGAGGSYDSGEASGSGGRPRTSGSTTSSMEDQEPSFFSVVLGPRRALRVVNGLESP